MKFKIYNFSRGITLVEVIVVVFIIATFSSILLSDFPKTKEKFALSRAVYKLAQELRRAQDMALSGVQTLKDDEPAKGYGIYINLSTLGNKEYVLYGDFSGNNQAYDSGEELKTVDFSASEKGVIIKQINNTASSQSVSVNFRPPNPDIKISNLKGSNTRVEIVFGLENDSSGKNTKSVFVNKLGLIETK